MNNKIIRNRDIVFLEDQVGEDVKKVEKELEALLQTQGNLSSLFKEQILDKSNYTHNKRKTQYYNGRVKENKTTS